MVRRAWYLLFVTAMVAAVAASAGCGQNKASGGSTEVGERYFVEGYLKVIDAEASSVYWGACAVVVGHEYTLRYTAEKWMWHVDSEMEMQITLPPQLRQTGGDTTWSGRDKRMTLEVKVIPTEVGEIEVTATAINLGNGYGDRQTITVHVTKTVAEAKDLLNRPREEKTGEVETIKDASE